MSPIFPLRLRPRFAALVGAACLAAAVALTVLIPAVFGTPVRQIHVIWHPDSDAVRTALETELRLTEATPLGDGRWSYVPGDVRPDTLRRLVTHPAVATTDGIAPDSFELSDSAPLTERRGGVLSMRRAARAARVLQLTLALAGAGLLAFAFLSVTGGTIYERASRSLRVAWGAASGILGTALDRLRRMPSIGTVLAGTVAFAQRGVPVASADAAGLFRIVFGAAVVTYVTSDSVSSGSISAYDFGAAGGIYEAIVRWLAGHPGVVDELGRIMWLLGLLFVAGIATPVTYTMFVAAVVLWGSTRALGASHHVMSVLLVALIALIPVRWGDALSVDAWALRRIGRGAARPASRRYGMAIWIPSFVFGVAFAAAAWSKLREGPAWIVNGTVKYHFVSDFEDALVPWGLALVDNHALAVALSAGAVAIELFVITAAFSRSAAYRVVCGLLGLVMLCGFALFQGVIWPAWWLLLLGFLPWHWYRALHHGGEPRRLSPVHLAIIALVVVQQLYASWWRVEARPMISAYDMYSTTYADAAAYEEASNLVYRVVGATPSGTIDLPDCTIDSSAADVFARAAGGDVDQRERIKSLIGPCLGEFPDVQQVHLEGDKQVFDWEASRFVWKRRLERVGPTDAAWLRP